MEIFIIIFVIIISIVFILNRSRVFNRPTAEEIGQRGEQIVSNFLSGFPDSIIFNDLTLFDEKTKKSTQIDHIVIRHNGVFVVETKNLAGRIYGNDNQREWIQVLAYGKDKNRFYNPIKQNITHIYSLAKTLKMSNVYVSVVVFPRAELYIQTETQVCNNEKSLWQTLNSNTGIILTTEQMQNIKNKLTIIKENPPITKESHIHNIYRTQNDIVNNICPRCGNSLVLRSGKNGEFYGCSNYPNCHFTKNL